MKKLFKGLLVLLLCFGIVGCGNSADKSSLYDSVINKINEIDYTFDFIDDSTLIICDSSNESTFYWKNGFKVIYLSEPATYLNDSYVANIRFYDDSYYDDLSIEDYDLDENAMLTIYNPVEDYSKGEKNPKFYKDIPMYDSFINFINKLGLSNEDELIEFLNLAYANK